MTVGEIVKNRREDLQMTQEELASPQPHILSISR